MDGMKNGVAMRYCFAGEHWTELVNFTEQNGRRNALDCEKCLRNGKPPSSKLNAALVESRMVEEQRRNAPHGSDDRYCRTGKHWVARVNVPLNFAIDKVTGKLGDECNSCRSLRKGATKLFKSGKLPPTRTAIQLFANYIAATELSCAIIARRCKRAATSSGPTSTTPKVAIQEQADDLAMSACETYFSMVNLQD